jgi:hypothetical protein
MRAWVGGRRNQIDPIKKREREKEQYKKGQKAEKKLEIGTEEERKERENEKTEKRTREPGTPKRELCRPRLGSFSTDTARVFTYS